MLKCRSKLAKITLAALAGLCITVPAFASDYNVEINKTSVLRLSRPAAAVVIGNPKIADISVHSSDTLLLSGRGFGATNILAFDEFGQTIMDAEIQVSLPKSGSAVRVNNIGDGYKTFNCNPNCLPSPVLGDTTEFIGNFEGENIISTNAVATGPSTTITRNAESSAPQAQELQR